jgi:hypothetical protein
MNRGGGYGALYQALWPQKHDFVHLHQIADLYVRVWYVEEGGCLKKIVFWRLPRSIRGACARGDVSMLCPSLSFPRVCSRPASRCRYYSSFAHSKRTEFKVAGGVCSISCTTAPSPGCTWHSRRRFQNHPRERAKWICPRMWRHHRRGRMCTLRCLPGAFFSNERTASTHSAKPGILGGSRILINLLSAMGSAKLRMANRCTREPG